MDVQRSELSDRGGSRGANRRASSIFVSSVGALFALVIAPLAVIAISNAVPPASASAEVSVPLIVIFAIAALLLSGFGVLGAIIGGPSGSRPVVVYGWIVTGVLLASAVLLGAAAILLSAA